MVSNKHQDFFDKLIAGLLERHVVQSDVDRYLFVKEDLICLVYVDDIILVGSNLDAINKEITRSSPQLSA